MSSDFDKDALAYHRALGRLSEDEGVEVSRQVLCRDAGDLLGLRPAEPTQTVRADTQGKERPVDVDQIPSLAVVEAEYVLDMVPPEPALVLYPGKQGADRQVHPVRVVRD